MSIPFVDPFDEEIATAGPAGLFTLNHDGDLCFDLVQSRYLRKHNEPPFPVHLCHCMLIDTKTRWPQYALITSKRLTTHPQAEIVSFKNQNEALMAVEQQKKQLMSIRAKPDV